MMQTTSNTHQIITLTDGRQLGYAEYGSSTGTPVLFCHGAPGSRLSIFADMDQAAAQRGIRLISPDRPGYGLSTFKPSDSLLDWTNDARELLVKLEIQRCKVIGFSMGSMFAFACAHALPQHIERVAIVGAAAPMEVEGVLDGLSTTSCELFALARADVATFSDVINSMASDGSAVFAAMTATMSEPDKLLLVAHTQVFTNDFNATVATGAQGVTTDLILAANPWGFLPAEINCHVDLWVGSEDINTPPAMTRYMAHVLPNNRVFELQGEGHCCLYTHWGKILDTLLKNT
jgi:pimeloyl-ACP methyl ester carboxylesterase